MEKEKQKIRKLYLVSSDFYNQLNSRIPKPPNLLGIENDFFKIFQNSKLSPTEKMLYYNNLLKIHQNARNSVPIEQKRDVQTQATNSTEFATQTEKYKSKKRGRRSRESTPYSSFMETVDESSETVVPAEDFRNQFFKENIYDNLPINEVPAIPEEDEAMDLSAEQESFLNTLKEQSGNPDASFRDFSFKHMDNPNKSFAIARHKKTNDTLTLEKPQKSKKNEASSSKKNQSRQSFSPLKTRTQRIESNREIKEHPWHQYGSYRTKASRP